MKYIRLFEIHTAAEGKNIPVFFEKENINTMNSKGEITMILLMR